MLIYRYTGQSDSSALLFLSNVTLLSLSLSLSRSLSLSLSRSRTFIAHTHTCTHVQVVRMRICTHTHTRAYVQNVRAIVRLQVAAAAANRYINSPCERKRQIRVSLSLALFASSDA